jgi:hypothetical protein
VRLVDGPIQGTVVRLSSRSDGEREFFVVTAPYADHRLRYQLSDDGLNARFVRKEEQNAR